MYCIQSYSEQHKAPMWLTSDKPGKKHWLDAVNETGELSPNDDLPYLYFALDFASPLIFETSDSAGVILLALIESTGLPSNIDRSLIENVCISEIIFEPLAMDPREVERAQAKHEWSKLTPRQRRLIGTWS